MMSRTVVPRSVAARTVVPRSVAVRPVEPVVGDGSDDGGLRG